MSRLTISLPSGSAIRVQSALPSTEEVLQPLRA